MHDVLRKRLLRRIESLPERQMYQVLDYIEFLEAKYGQEAAEEETSGLQKFAESLEDRLRKKAVNPATIREAFQFIAAADRALSNVRSAGKHLMSELSLGGDATADGVEPEPADGAEPEPEDDPEIDSAGSDDESGPEANQE